MLYFAGADYAGRKRRNGKRVGFLTSGDSAFCKMIDEFYTQVINGTFRGADIQEAIAPWNLVGLCDPSKKNMYDYT